eukprot:SM003630S13717  [mRNA]  locus=s3630:48:1418:+ [translate_table: standard]
MRLPCVLLLLLAALGLVVFAGFQSVQLQKLRYLAAVDLANRDATIATLQAQLQKSRSELQASVAEAAAAVEERDTHKNEAGLLKKEVQEKAELAKNAEERKVALEGAAQQRDAEMEQKEEALRMAHQDLDTARHQLQEAQDVLAELKVAHHDEIAAVKAEIGEHVAEQVKEELAKVQERQGGAGGERAAKHSGERVHRV